jgi:hypothetical protein
VGAIIREKEENRANEEELFDAGLLSMYRRGRKINDDFVLFYFEGVWLTLNPKP